MSLLSDNLVNWVIFSPLLFAALVLLFPAKEEGQIRGWALIGMGVNFALSVWMYLSFDVKGAEFQLETRTHWMDAVGMSFHTGVDGLAVSLMLLTGLLGPVVVLASWKYIHTRVKEFYLALLLIQCAMMGAFGSLDIILFYVFFEAMLVPMYLLVGVWGAEERQMAATKFFIYTVLGSLLMLVAILAIYFISQPTGARSFDYADIYNGLTAANRELGNCAAKPELCGAMSELARTLHTYGPWLFFAFALAFAIKVPMFPVHTWLPDAHVQAPVAGSIILAGVMLKMGTFGFWRFAVPLFPAAARQFRTGIVALAVIGIVYGAMMCLAQRDIKKLIAYSSVSHLGYCMLGIFAMTAEGATGSAYQMLNHGVSTGALFLLFGFLYERRHTRLMSDFGGIAKVMPLYAALFVIVTFSSIALPGTNGFIGEFLVLLGTFRAEHLSLWWGVAGSVGVILGAAYMLLLVQRVFFGPLTQPDNLTLKDLSLRETLTAMPLVALIFVMGLMPQPFLDRLQPSVERLVARAHVGATLAAGDPSARFIPMTVMPLPPLPIQPAFPGATPAVAVLPQP